VRPKILPYGEMVKWVLDSVDITNRKFKTQNQEHMKSFLPQNLRFILKDAQEEKSIIKEAQIKKPRQFPMRD